MTDIGNEKRPAFARKCVRRLLPLAVLVAATILAGCVAYPYPGGYYAGYHHPHPYYGDPGYWH